MRTTPLGIVMLNDERERVYTMNNPLNMRVVRSWARLIEENLVNVDESKPEIITGSEIITSIRSAQKVGEELSRANCKQLIMCYNVWDNHIMAIVGDKVEALNYLAEITGIKSIILGAEEERKREIPVGKRVE